MSSLYQDGHDRVARVECPPTLPAAPVGWNETLERASELGIELLERTAAVDRTEGVDRFPDVEASCSLPLPPNPTRESALRELRLTQTLADLRREERARGHRSEAPSHEETAFW